jgi:hypothetical protein
MTEIVVGLVADPGLPAEVAGRVREDLAVELSRRVDRDREWRVEVLEEVVPLDESGNLQLVRRAEELHDLQGWEMAFYITDLPHYAGKRPVVAEVAPEQHAAVLYLPALGLVRLRHRVIETLGRIAEHLYSGSVDLGLPERTVTGDPDRPEALTALTPLGGTTSDAFSGPGATSGGHHGGDGVLERVESHGLFGNLRLLLGMVRANQPARLPRVMKTSAAAASAAGAYGVFFGSIWVLADSMALQRQVLLTLLALGALTSWLIATNGLWTRSRGRSGLRWAAMDNAATIVTVGVATAMMYAGLLLLLTTAAIVIIPPHYLAEELGHAVAFIDYLDLTWLATSMGIMAGAVGASFDHDEAIRNATYSRRDLERRNLTRSTEPSRDGW